MNCRERVLQALSFKEAEHLPYTLPLEPEIIQMLDQHFGNSEWQKSIHNHIGLVRTPALSIPESSSPRARDLFGSTWRTEMRPAHIEKPALAQPTLEGYPFPTIDDIWDETLLLPQVASAQSQGLFVVATTGLGLFERSWSIRGFESALIDMKRHPDFYHALLDEILNLQIQYIQRLDKFPIDAIMLSDDWGYQQGVIMGPKLWREFFKPRAEKFFSAVHGTNKWTIQHCCGNIFPILGEMIEIGLDILESVQPEAMDIYEIKRRYGNQLRLWGGLGTQQIIPFGTPSEIKMEVKRLCQEVGRGGGYILSPAKPIMAGVPLQNVLAVLEAFNVHIHV